MKNVTIRRCPTCQTIGSHTDQLAAAEQAEAEAGGGVAAAVVVPQHERLAQPVVGQLGHLVAGWPEDVVGRSEDGPPVAPAEVEQGWGHRVS